MTQNRSKRRQPCAREGCNRFVRTGYTACSNLCNIIVGELESAERICQAVGDSEHWANSVALSDAITEYYNSLARVGNKARDAGITWDEWRLLKTGRPAL